MASYFWVYFLLLLMQDSTRTAAKNKNIYNENRTSKRKSLIYRNALSLSFGRPLLMSCRRRRSHTFHEIIQYRKFCSDRKETYCCATEITWPAFWAFWAPNSHHNAGCRLDQRRAEIREKNIPRVKEDEKKKSRVKWPQSNRFDMQEVVRFTFAFLIFLLFFGKWQKTLHLVMCSGYRETTLLSPAAACSHCSTGTT